MPDKHLWTLCYVRIVHCSSIRAAAARTGVVTPTELFNDVWPRYFGVSRPLKGNFNVDVLVQRPAVSVAETFYNAAKEFPLRQNTVAVTYPRQLERS